MAWGKRGRGVFSGGHPAGLEDKNGDNMAPQYLLVTKKNKTLLPAEVGRLSTWLPRASQTGCRVGTESQPPAPLVQASSQCHGLSQVLVKIQGLGQMLTHSLRFSSL